MKQLVFIFLLVSTSVFGQDIKFRVENGQLKYSFNGQPYEFVVKPASGSVTGGLKLGSNMSIDVNGRLVISGVTSVTGGKTSQLVNDIGYQTGDQVNSLLLPISTAVNQATNGLSLHTVSQNNPHNTTKAQVGLGNVPNVDATNPANIVQNSGNRFVADTEKTNWNGKVDAFIYNQNRGIDLDKINTNAAGLLQKLEAGTKNYVRAINSSAIPSVQIPGTGGGLFSYDPLDTSTPDDSVLTLVAQGGRRYKRVVTDHIYQPQWWDTDSDPAYGSTEINKAISRLPAGSILLISGRIAINSTILFRRGITLRGAAGTFDDGGRGYIKLSDNANVPMLQTPRAWQGAGAETHFMALENLVFDANEANQTVQTTAIQFWGAFIGSHITNCLFKNAYGRALTFGYGSDVYVNRVWVLNTVAPPGKYAVDINPDATGTESGGLMTFGQFYVENTMNKKGGNAYAVEADRGDAIRINRGLKVTMFDTHLECFRYGLTVESAQTVKIVSISSAWAGNSTINDAAVISYIDAQTKTLKVETFTTETPSNRLWWVKKRIGVTSNTIPDLPITGGKLQHVGYSAVSETGFAAQRQAKTVFANEMGVEKVGATDRTMIKLYQSADTLTDYSYLRQQGTQLIIGSNVSQTGKAEVDFLTINSLGGNGNNLQLNVPLYLFNRTFPNDLGVGSFFRYNGVPSYGFGANRIQNFSTISSGPGAPSSTPDWVGQLYVDTQNRRLYVANAATAATDWVLQTITATAPLSFSAGVLSVQNAPSFSGNVTVNGGGVLLDNNAQVRAKDVGGAYSPLVVAGGDNSTILSSLGNGINLTSKNLNASLLRILENGNTTWLTGANLFVGTERVNAAGGEALFSGNGSAVTFSIPHGIGYKPTKYTAQPGSDDVGTIKKVTADATNINVTLSIAPPTGTGNVQLNWTAR